VEEVDRVCLEDMVAVHCCGVDVFVEFAGVERGVLEVADCEENGICGRWQEAAAPAHKGHLCVESEVEASAHVPAARGSAAAPAPGAWCVRKGAVVVARHYIWGSVGRWR
jgi:hypothetical protein